MLKYFFIIIIIIIVLLNICISFHQSCFIPNLNYNVYTIYKSNLILNGIGFGKSIEKLQEFNRFPKINHPCSCGSQVLYKECCHSFHNNIINPINPIQVIRGRFSALVYGVIPFIIKTTHPDNKEYIAEEDTHMMFGSTKTKRIVWEKEVISHIYFHSIT